MLSSRCVLAEDVQKLRKELRLTLRELAAALRVDPKEIAAWEAGERFPTKRAVEAMQRLREQGAAAAREPSTGAPATRETSAGAAPRSDLARLADPDFWGIVRKLVAHPAFFTEVRALAEKYPDPEPSASQPGARRDGSKGA
ncbi:MAG: helix-turn-helix transcriptional regulator [Pseudomonadota bacterium]